MKKSLILTAFAFAFAFVVAFAVGVMALTVNPTSNVLGDSADTANTLIYRDDSGDFSASGVIVTNGTSGRLHLPTATTTQLRLISPAAVGDMWVVTNDNGSFVRLCVSSGTTGGAVIIATAAAAAPCIN